MRKIAELLGINKKPSSTPKQAAPKQVTPPTKITTTESQKLGESTNIIMPATLHFPFVEAAEAGDVTAIKEMIAAKHNVNEADKSGKTALHVACINGNSELADILIKAGADKEAKRTKGVSAVSSGLTLHQSVKNITPLIDACTTPSFDTISLLIKAGANPKASTSTLITPLHYACCEGKFDIIQLLLQSGTDHIAKDKNGSTPMHYLCMGNISDNIQASIQLLIKKLSDANIANGNDETALHFAIKFANPNNKQILVSILSKICNVNSANYSEELPLHMACRLRDAQLIELLAPLTKDINAIDFLGNTPFMLLKTMNEENPNPTQYEECVTILQKYGSNTSISLAPQKPQ